MRRSIDLVLVCGGFALASLLVAGPAAAIDRQACFEAYVRAQELKQAGRLIDAHAAALSCAQSGCPEGIATECASFRAALEPALPSIVVGVRDEMGAERVDARVFVDGALVQQRIDGRAVNVDPGPHVVRVVLADGRSVETQLVAKEGERLRLVELRASASPDVAPPPGRSRGLAPLGLVLGGVALAGLGVGTGFLVSGWWGDPSKTSLDDCKPTCSRDDVDDVKRKLLIGNVALAVGVLAAAAATYVIVNDRLSVAATADGGFVVRTGRRF